MIFRLQTIYVKPYVKAYYDRVGFDKELTKLLIILLKSQSSRFDTDIENQGQSLQEWNPEIPEHIFTEYGNRLTLTDARDFANYLENRFINIFKDAIQAELEFCELNHVTFLLQAVLLKIRDERLELSEDDLPLETIRKRMQRFCYSEVRDFKARKKLCRNVPKNSKNRRSSRRLPEGYLWLEDWLKLARIDRSTFFRRYRYEFPTQMVGNKLAIETVKV